MAETEYPQDAAPKKKSKRPMIIGLVLAILLGGGGFFATFSGMILGPHEQMKKDANTAGALPDIAFVPVDSIIISLGAARKNSQLKMTAQLEVDKAYVADVTLLMPRIVDVLNSYLRAAEVSQIEDPAGLMMLRAQMLRRIQVVTGEGRVRDLLISEFLVT